MSIVEENLPVVMTHDDLTRTPTYSLPKDYTIRFYEPGDEEHWIRIHEKTDNFNVFSLERFQEVFSDFDVKLTDRQLYLLSPAGDPVGTATAWLGDFQKEKRGKIHWVAVLPNYQGNGLANSLLSKACSQLIKLGHPDAFLKTSTARIAAINLYWKFGFRPLIHKEEDDAIWEQLKRYLKKD